MLKEKVFHEVSVLIYPDDSLLSTFHSVCQNPNIVSHSIQGDRDYESL